MPHISDELALHEALHDLTDGQPTQPVDRVTAVRRRHVRRRALQSAGTAAAAAVAIVGALLVGGTVGDRAADPINRPVPSWALPWPDHRDGSVPQEVLDGAVTAWRHGVVNGTTGPHAADTVVWYVGQTAVHGDQVVAMFEVDGAAGRWLVTAQANASNVMDGQPAFDNHGFSPWVTRDVPAPDPRTPPPLVGLNVSDGFGNWIVVLTQPRYVRLHWSAPGSPGDDARLRQGLAVVDTGEVRGPVTVSLAEPGAAERIGPVNELPVGLPGNRDSEAPQLAPVAELDTGGQTVDAGIGGQGATTVEIGYPNSRRQVVIFARCYGGAMVHLQLDGGPFAVNVPCDDEQHRFDGPRLRRLDDATVVVQGHGHMLSVDADMFTAYEVAVVLR